MPKATVTIDLPEPPTGMEWHNVVVESGPMCMVYRLRRIHEALRERCGRILTLPPHTGAWDTRYDCTREPGHAGEYGV